MYSMQVTAWEAWGSVQITVSLAETNELGSTEIIATVSTTEDRDFAHLAADSLELFLERASLALVKAVSTAQY